MSNVIANVLFSETVVSTPNFEINIQKAETVSAVSRAFFWNDGTVSGLAKGKSEFDTLEERTAPSSANNYKYRPEKRSDRSPIKRGVTAAYHNYLFEY